MAPEYLLCQSLSNLQTSSWEELLLQLYGKFNLKEIPFHIVPLTRADLEFLVANLTLLAHKNTEKLK